MNDNKIRRGVRDKDEVFDRNVRNTGSVTDPSFLVTPNRPEPRYEPMLGTTGSAFDPTILNAPSPIGRSGYTNPRQVTFQDSGQIQDCTRSFTQYTDRFSTKLVPKLFCAYTNTCPTAHKVVEPDKFDPNTTEWTDYMAYF